jgi:hypothetical protein
MWQVFDFAESFVHEKYLSLLEERNNSREPNLRLLRAASRRPAESQLVILTRSHIRRRNSLDSLSHAQISELPGLASQEYS